MTQPTAGPATTRETSRERHRRQRREEFLEVALKTVATEGLGALTMARVTEEIGCATGSIYHYFPTKGALVAAIQLDALQQLGRSLQESQGHLEQLLAEEQVAPDLAALTKVVVAARFWIAAEQTFPREIELCRRLFTEPGFELADDEAAPVVSPTMALLELARGLLDGAAEQGALHPGPGVDRAIQVLAGTTGVMLTSALRRWDSDMFEGQRMAQGMLHDLLSAWGAAHDHLAFAGQIADTLVERGQLVPGPAVTIELP